MLRRVLLATSRSDRLRRSLQTIPYTRSVVRRFVAGETLEDALDVTRRLRGEGLLVTLDHLGEDTHDKAQADTIVTEYLALLAHLPEGAEVSVKLSALGLGLDEGLAFSNARKICEAAETAGTTVTLDMEEHTTVGSTLRILTELRSDHPTVGAVIQAYLRKAEEYCAELSYPGSRVRLCKGAYDAPETVAFTGRKEIDRSYVRCMKVLMAGAGYPMLATHDPRMIDIAQALAARHDRRGTRGFEYQMLYGIRPNEQLRLAELGEQVRIYVPYGGEWYGYLMRRLAERPANLAFFLRSLATRS